jgi:hypothetical protein
MRAPTGSRLLAAALAVAALSASGAAWAGSGTFTDVPADHPFVNEIEAVASAGITTGFGDGTYRPNQSVTRGAMAAFMGRGFGRASSGNLAGTVSAAGGFTSVGSTTLTAGATGGGGGFALLTATLTFTVVSAENCPCRVGARLNQIGGGPQLPAEVDIPFFGIPFALQENVMLTTTYLLPADTTATYTVEVDSLDSTTGVQVDGELTAMYVPFDGSGNTP